MASKVYIDDIIFGSTKDDLAQKLATTMQSEIEMSLVGKSKFLLGFKVKQKKDGVFLSQAKYVKELVKKFCLENITPSWNPMSTTLKIHQDLSGKEVEKILDRSMITSLLYFIFSHLDISFSLRYYARYQANPKESHFATVKGIIKYVSITLEFGILYPWDTTTKGLGILMLTWLGAKMIRRVLQGLFLLG